MPDDPPTAPPRVSDRWPRLRRLEERVEQAKLHGALFKAQADTAAAAVPSLDVDIAKDGVTAGQPTGLGRPLAQAAAVALADDIADLVLDALRQARPERPFHCEVVVLDDPGFLQVLDEHRHLEAATRRLAARVAAVAPEGQAEDDTEEVVATLLPLLPAVPALAGLAAQGLSLVSKLRAADYQRAGGELVVGDLGFDVLLIRHLRLKQRSDEHLEVRAARLAPAPLGGLLEELDRLAESSDALRPVAAGLETLAVEAETALEQARSDLAAMDAQLLALIEHRPGNDLANVTELQERRDRSAERLVSLARAGANARAAADSHAELLDDVDGYLAEVFLAPADGGPAPAVRAARAGRLLEDPPTDGASVVLYARLLAGGVDQTVRTSWASDRWTALVGVTAEFALLQADGTVLECGTRTTMQSSSAKLADPSTFRQERVGYSPLDRRP